MGKAVNFTIQPERQQDSDRHPITTQQNLGCISFSPYCRESPKRYRIPDYDHATPNYL